MYYNRMKGTDNFTQMIRHMLLLDSHEEYNIKIIPMTYERD